MYMTKNLEIRISQDSTYLEIFKAYDEPYANASKPKQLGFATGTGVGPRPGPGPGPGPLAGPGDRDGT